MRSMWIRALAIGFTVVYLLLLAGTWLANAMIPDWGIVRGARWPNPDRMSIMELAPGGPAERAGLAPGDAIISVDGQPLSDRLLLSWALTRRMGDQVEVQVQRQVNPSIPESTADKQFTLALAPRLTMPAFVATLAVYTLIGLLAVLVSLAVVLSRPMDWAARLLALGMGAYALALLVDNWGYQFYQLWLTQFFLYLFVLGSAAILHLFLVFPIENPAMSRLRRLGPDRWQRLNLVLLLYGVPLGLSWLLTLGTGIPVVPTMALASVLLAGAVAVQLQNFKRARTLLQNAQVKLITLGLALGVLATGVITLALFDRDLEIVTLTLAASVWVFFPISIAVAILRYRLWDIEVIIHRTLVYGPLSALLVLIYAGSVLLLAELSRLATGQRQSELVTVLATLAIAFLFRPLHNRIQRAIDRRFYRGNYDAAQVLTAFGGTIREEVDLEKVVDELCQVVSNTMQPAHVSVWLRPHDE